MSDTGNSNKSTAGLRPWAPGQSGNPKGRPKGAEGFAKKIRKLTGNGKLLLQFAMEVASDPDSRDRMRAVEFLADRMLGKAPQKIEMTGKDGAPLSAALDRPLQGLSVDELLKLEILARRAIREADLGGGGPGVDAPAAGAPPADSVEPGSADGAAATVPEPDVP